MKISILAAAALLLAGTSMAQAAWDQIQTILDLQARGFTHTEITVGTTQAKVEASDGTTKVETIFDLVTGAVVKTETEAADPNESQTPGVEVKTSSTEAFVDDGEDHDHGGSSGPGSDDDQADDNGSDDDAADDNSGSSDDEGDDDHGGDDHGSDDHGGDDHGSDGGDDSSGHGDDDGGDDD